MALRKLAPQVGLWLIVGIGAVVIALVGMVPHQPNAQAAQAVAAPLADLTVDGMGIHDVANTNCLENPSDIRLVVQISNRGDADSGSFVLSVNGVRQLVDGLGAGKTTQVLFDATYGGQTTAIVDVDDQVVETDELNNELMIYVPVPTQLPACVLSEHLFLPTLRSTLDAAGQ